MKNQYLKITFQDSSLGITGGLERLIRLFALLHWDVLLHGDYLDFKESRKETLNLVHNKVLSFVKNNSLGSRSVVIISLRPSDKFMEIAPAFEEEIEGDLQINVNHFIKSLSLFIGV